MADGLFEIVIVYTMALCTWTLNPEARGHGIPWGSKRRGPAESRGPTAFQMTILPYEERDLFEIAESLESVEDVRFLTNMGIMECDDGLGMRITPCGRKSVKGVNPDSSGRGIRPRERAVRGGRRTSFQSVLAVCGREDDRKDRGDHGCRRDGDDLHGVVPAAGGSAVLARVDLDRVPVVLRRERDERRQV